MHPAARLLEGARRSNIGARAQRGVSLFTSYFSQHPECTQLRGNCQSATDSGNIKPLEGVKVLDLTRVLAGPFATMILGDLGAEVIKVEKPGSGDDTRFWGPPFVGSESAYFLSVNRNKKSIAVNLKDPKGTKIIKQLAQACDVLIENYIPGKLAEMGLGYEALMKTAPHVIYCSITGYGQTGPLFNRAGYDAVACAMSGLMHITGPEVACLTQIAANFLNGGIEAKRWGTAHGSIVPYQSFKAKDGYLVIGAGNDQQFSTVCRVMDLCELVDDPRFKTNKLRVQHRKELLQVLTGRFSGKTTAEWLELFEGSGIPYGPINSIKQVFSEPQVAHNGLILEMEHPMAGKISVAAKAMVRKKLTTHQRDLIVERHQSGEEYQRISKALEIPWNTVKTVIKKWITFGTTVTLPRTGRPSKL
ncbi:succinyl-CoA:glutarate CoA-transferase isoform X7 [Rhinoderma darwinii]|uniref:succinyl-CoA:glutarate CoA-transferase isoform X7 n=1 Tax=Rhinoderma darwinii TaxID=43563 RepID=UPI003F67DE41